MSKIKKIDEIIRMEESNAGRQLTGNEQVQRISEWLNIQEKDVRKYLKIMNMKDITGFTYKSDSFIDTTSVEPEKEYFSSLGKSENVKCIQDAVESFLSKTQDRTRECYRALFTGYCIDKSIYIEDLVLSFNSEILEEYQKSGKKPKQHEIYLKFHPDVTKNSANVRASEMLKKMLGGLATQLKEELKN
jgi:hypothetical protein